MAQFRERVTSKGERKWQAVVRRDGFPDKRATFPSKRDAERWARIMEGEFAKGKHLPSLEAERHTLADLFDRFDKELAPKRRKAVAAHLKWWRAALGGKKLSELTPATLREQLDRLGTEPYLRAVQRKAVTLTPRRKPKEDAPPPATYKRGPASVNRYKETLSKALTVAVNEYEWMPENPLAKIPDRKEPRGRVRYLTATERNSLLEACQASGADLHALVVTALCTGARAGELLGLTWRDVDLERKRAILNRTKNDERRALSLAGPALEALRERAKVRRIDTDLVFPAPLPEKPATKDAKEAKPGPFDYAKPFRDAVTAAGITDFRFHDLRHTAASYLAMNGATTGEIADVLGHKTLQMVKRYAHLSEQHVAGVVERMTDKIFGAAKPDGKARA
jgi:integrase